MKPAGMIDITDLAPKAVVGIGVLLQSVVVSQMPEGSAELLPLIEWLGKSAGVTGLTGVIAYFMYKENQKLKDKLEQEREANKEHLEEEIEDLKKRLGDK